SCPAHYTGHERAFFHRRSAPVCRCQHRYHRLSSERPDRRRTAEASGRRDVPRETAGGQHLPVSSTGRKPPLHRLFLPRLATASLIKPVSEPTYRPISARGLSVTKNAPRGLGSSTLEESRWSPVGVGRHSGVITIPQC